MRGTMKTKLLIFEDIFGWGGIETFITNVCKHIDKNEYDVRLVSVTKITNHFDELLNDNNIKFDVLLPEAISNPIIRFKLGVPKFDEYLKKVKPDIIHFNISDSIDFLYVNVAKKNGVKFRVVHSHNSSATSKTKKIAHYIGKLFLSDKSNYFVACSNKAAKWLFPNKIYKEKKYKIVHNAIDVAPYEFNIEQRNYIRKREHWDDRLVIGNVARFNPQKNHKYLIDIFKEIQKKENSAILIMVGSGPLQNEIEKYVDEQGLKDKVVFYGESDEVALLLKGFDVFLLPSFYEGLPFVLIESQAASLPGVISDTITREVSITNYLDYVSLDSSAKDWANIVIKASKKKRIDQKNNLIQNGYEVKSMVKDLQKYYQIIMNNIKD